MAGAVHGPAGTLWGGALTCSRLGALANRKAGCKPALQPGDTAGEWQAAQTLQRGSKDGATRMEVGFHGVLGRLGCGGSSGVVRLAGSICLALRAEREAWAFIQVGMARD